MKKPCVKLLAFAKINLALAIKEIYPDGYHALEMLNTSVDISDKITIRKRADRHVRCVINAGIDEQNNTAVTACRLFMEEFKVNGADIAVDKRIPCSAGLGGSSADAAGVIAGLAHIHNITDSAALSRLAARCGSDVSFMLFGGGAFVEGKGEKITPLKSGRTLHFVVAVNGRVLTKNAYSMFDKSPKFVSLDRQKLTAAFESGDIKGLNAFCLNSLQPASQKLEEGVFKSLALLRKTQAELVSMTGSGSAVFGLYPFRETALQAAEAVKQSCEECLYCKSVPAGIRILP